MAIKLTPNELRRRALDRGVHLPSQLDMVNIIAMQGFTDSEMESFCQLPEGVIKKWRKMYPSFDEAIEKGRTYADIAVVQALHRRATGFTKSRDVLVGTSDNKTVLT